MKLWIRTQALFGAYLLLSGVSRFEDRKRKVIEARAIEIGHMIDQRIATRKLPTGRNGEQNETANLHYEGK